MADGITCMAFTVSFIPNTGNKYFLAATDDTVRLYDFETAQVINWLKLKCIKSFFYKLYYLSKIKIFGCLDWFVQCMQSFDSMYTQYCDCGKFVSPVEPMEEKIDEDVILVESSKKAKKRSLPPQTAYYVTRGVELLDLNGSLIGSWQLFIF